jgi:hypothetical protein
MTKLHRLYARYGQSPWLTTAPAVTPLAIIGCGTGPKPMCSPARQDG